MRRLFYLFIALLLVSGGFAQQNASPFTMDDIKNWTGTGPNRAALAVQWVTGEDPTELVAEDIHFLVWGYRWEDGEKPSALDMIRAVAQNDSRFYVMLGDAGKDPVIWGFGYDADNSGSFSLLNKTTSVTIKQDQFVDGVVFLKADPDGFRPVDVADYWMGGWKEYYCSYYTGPVGNEAPSTADFQYSQFGASQRYLTNGSWDAWTLSAIDYVSEQNTPPVSKLMQAAEANDPTGNESLSFSDTKAYYSARTLFMENMNNYTCRIVSMNGSVVKYFLVRDEKEVLPVNLQKGIYILSAVKGNKSVSYKFVVND